MFAPMMLIRVPIEIVAMIEIILWVFDCTDCDFNARIAKNIEDKRSRSGTAREMKNVISVEAHIHL